eukprot:CAMPEP_0117418970 /NCGR_PEP_ID=MMETSP0758-20121206/645_1 /TAXON_ID=63605 /ORGANISM="Percolomonas cosmopolitus, Strain AE-1 (ATCC 50343)" /LENGTH=1111 /DNA_ID=CAMNT_0005199793 /DNA_START=8 /DNA_END=3340 /DNA_ORIENTATION=-
MAEITTEEVRHFTETDTTEEMYMEGIDNILNDVSLVKSITESEKQTIQEIIFTIKKMIVEEKKMKVKMEGVKKPKMSDIYEHHILKTNYKNLYYNYNRYKMKKSDPKLKYLPTTIQVIGSYMLKTGIRQQANIDIAIDIPEKYITDDDLGEYQYHLKRAAYLVGVKSHIEQHRAMKKMMEIHMEDEEEDEAVYVKEINMEPFRGDTLKPIIEIILSEQSPIRIIRIIPFLNANQFSKLNVFRSNGKLGVEHKPLERSLEKIHDPTYRKIMMPSPYYNHSVAEDKDLMNHVDIIHETLQYNVNSVKTLSILKLWLRQREINANPLSINGFLITMIVIYLLKENRIASQLSVYQQLRIVLEFLSELKPYQHVLYIKKQKEKNDNQQAFFEETMKLTFPLNIIHGRFNIAWRVTPCALAEVQYEAKMSLKALNWGIEEIERSFSCLFSRQPEEYQKYDACIKLQLAKDVHQMNTLKMMRIYDIACYKALFGKRARVISIRPTEEETIWMISIKVNVNYEYYHDPVLYGPTQYAMNPTKANQAVIDEFKKKWGSLATTLQERQTLFHVVEFGEHLETHHPLIYIEYIMQQLIQVTFISIELRQAQITLLGKPFIEQTFIPQSLIQSYAFSIEEAFDTLDVLIREVNLSMKIKRLEQLSNPVRSTNFILPLNGVEKYDGLFVHPIMMSFGNENKWPEIPKTIHQLKQLVLIRLAESLKQHVVQFTPQWLDLIIQGHLFRLSIFNQMEYSIYTTTGHILDKKVQQIEKTFVITPKHLTFMNGLQSKYPIIVDIIRLFKNWLNESVMLSDSFEDYHVELFVAYVFTTALIEGKYHDVPQTLLPGLARVWKSLSTFNFKENVFYVAFEGDDQMEVKMEKLNELKNQSTKPIVTIGATYAELNELSKFENPSLASMIKLKNACRKAYAHLVDQLDIQLFSDKDDYSYESILKNTCSFDIVYDIQQNYRSNASSTLSTEDIDRITEDTYDFSDIKRISVVHPIHELIYLIRQRYGDFIEVHTNGSNKLGFIIADQLKNTPDQSWPIGISFSFATDGLELAPTLDYRLDNSRGKPMYFINLYNIMKGIDNLVACFFDHVDREYITVEPKFNPSTRKREHDEL